MSLKQELHDKLWLAFERWQKLAASGATKWALKQRGLKECCDPNRYTRNLIFARATAESYERALSGLLVMAEREFGAKHLADIGKREWKAFMDRSIEQGLAAKTLKRYASAIAKLGCLTGQSASAIAVSAKYHRAIRERVERGELPGPTRATPSPDIARRAVEILRAWDARHFERTDEPRAYHLVARLQLETGCRRISATSRVTAESLKGGNKIELVAKGGRHVLHTVSPELHSLLSRYLAAYRSPLADECAYQQAYARAIRDAGGQVTGTHGLRRLSSREFYVRQYRAAVGSGLSPSEAAEQAAGDAIERLGHSRNRRDHRKAYLRR